MAEFYDVPVQWLDETQSTGRGIGNNAAWTCRCGEVLLGPHVDIYSIPACPGCGRVFNIVRGAEPQFVHHVEEATVLN